MEIIFNNESFIDLIIKQINDINNFYIYFNLYNIIMD
jgi:hypothetical protein